jgi:hypothetical protein
LLPPFIGEPDHLSVLLFSRLIKYWVRKLSMSTSITISYPCQLLSLSVSHNSIPGDHAQNKILIIHVLLIHVSETFNTTMSLHAKNCIVVIFAADMVNKYCYLPLSVSRITWVFYCFRDWLNIEYVHFHMKLLEYTYQ